MAVCEKSVPCDNLVTGPGPLGESHSQTSSGDPKRGKCHKVLFGVLGAIGISFARCGLDWTRLGSGLYSFLGRPISKNKSCSCHAPAFCKAGLC